MDYLVQEKPLFMQKDINHASYYEHSNSICIYYNEYSWMTYGQPRPMDENTLSKFLDSWY